MEVRLNSPLAKRGEGVEVVKAARVVGAIGVLVSLTDLLPPMEEERRKMDFLAKSIFWSSVVRKATPVMRLKPFDSGTGASLTIETIMKTLI